MTKLEVEMMNNELEARVIELEAQYVSAQAALAEAEAELKETQLMHATAEGELEDLHAYVEQQEAEHPPERYADWYKRLHPVAGGEPDARVLAEHVRIIA